MDSRAKFRDIIGCFRYSTVFNYLGYKYDVNSARRNAGVKWTRHGERDNISEICSDRKNRAEWEVFAPKQDAKSDEAFSAESETAHVW